MEQDHRTLAAFYDGWDRYNNLLIEAIAPLSPAQLALAAAPSLRPVWLIAAHIAGTRVGWFGGLMGEGDAALAPLYEWDVDGAPPRTAAELVDALKVTWQMIADCLDRWTPAMLDDTFVEHGNTVTRQWVIWHVIEHDLSHGGELFLTLGAHGLPTPDL